MATGKSPVQHSKIIWSYLTRGNVALNQTNKKQKRQVLRPKIILCMLKKVSLMNSSGISQPPINKMALKVDIKTIEQYSPKKKNTNIIELCSVKNPATSSDSFIIANCCAASPYLFLFLFIFNKVPVFPFLYRRGKG